MRIRKRFPVPLSDPQLVNRSPVVQVQLHPQPISSDVRTHDSQPSDPTNQPSDVLPIIGTQKTKHKQELDVEEKIGKEKWGMEQEKMNNDTRKGNSSILGAQVVGSGIKPPSVTTSHQGRWCEKDKVVPLKKRKGSFEANQEEDEQERFKEKKKKNKRGSGSGGGVIMEGSRCSRVNGRGWRCCQQTLVGYSLCEHHLGKGRLRSINTTSIVAEKNPLSLFVQQKQKQDQVVSDDVEEEYGQKKRVKKLGVVKARSISSLLGQQPPNTTNTTTAAKVCDHEIPSSS